MPTLHTYNAAIAYLIRQRSPHLSARQLARAVRMEDQRDTFGRKRFERVQRVPLTAEVEPSTPAPDASSPLLEAVCKRLDAAGLSALVPHMMQGLSISEAARAAGVPERTARHKLTEIR